jgi:hypothetical protein
MPLCSGINANAPNAENTSKSNAPHIGLTLIPLHQQIYQNNKCHYTMEKCKCTYFIWLFIKKVEMFLFQEFCTTEPVPHF